MIPVNLKTCESQTVQQGRQSHFKRFPFVPRISTQDLGLGWVSAYGSVRQSSPSAFPIMATPGFSPRVYLPWPELLDEDIGCPGRQAVCDGL